jgi:hypothetical protein
MAKPSQGRRPIVWISVAVIVVVVAAALLVVGLGGGTTTSSTTSTSSGVTTSTTTQTCAGSSSSQTITIITGPVVVGTTGDVAAGVTCADGHLGNMLYYQYGQDVSVRVSVPDSLTPTMIDTVFDGNPQNANPWDVNSTGHTYVLGFGGAGQTVLTACPNPQPCLHDFYAIVTFADGSTATSNVVYITVTGSPAPGSH